MINKKASGTIYMAPWLFLIWIVITVVVVIMTTIILDKSFDVREKEAEILADRIANCLFKNFTYSQATDINFNLMSICGFNEKFLENSDKHSYKIIITSDYFEPKKSSIVLSAGRNFEQECEYKDTKGEAEKSFAQCANKIVYIVDKTTNKPYVINITTASKQK